MCRHRSPGTTSKSHKPKGSTVCITVMFLGWIWYVVFSAFVYWKVHAWFPMEITWGTIGLFLVETVSLLRLKLAKEGEKLLPKKSNPMVEKVGVVLPDLEEEVQIEVEKQAKEHTNGNEDQLG